MKIDKTIFKVTFTRGTGAGGQHKNKVETCAVVTRDL
jgi:protein subunit release factor B